MTPILYESSEQSFTSLGLGALTDAVSCYVRTVLNGQFELEMIYPVSGVRYHDLKISRIIKAKAEKGGTDQLFDIYAITRPINGMVTINASHVSGRKQFIPVMPCTASSVQNALTVINSHVAETNPFTLSTDKTTAGSFALKVPASLGQVLGGMQGSLLDVYGGEYEFNNFNIKLWNHRGQDNGVTLRYGKNITSIEQEESIASTVTGICPFWADLEGNLITLSEKTVDSPNASNFPFKRTIVKDFSAEFDSQPTEAQLRAYAQVYISANNIGVPAVGFDLSYENLADYEEFKDTTLFEQVKLGDTIHVYFEPLEITATARVTETIYDTLLDKYRKIRVGSVKSNLSSVINDNVKSVSQALNENTGFLETAFNNALELLSGADGGNIVINRNSVTGKPYEILIMDSDDVTKAEKVLRLNMEGLGLSTNGINGPYTAAITADGIVATVINTGVLNAALIKTGILSSDNEKYWLNLDTGEMKMKSGEIGGWTVDSTHLYKTSPVTTHQFTSVDSARMWATVNGQLDEATVLASYPYYDLDGDGHITAFDCRLAMCMMLGIIPNGTITSSTAQLNSGRPYGSLTSLYATGQGFIGGAFGVFGTTVLGNDAVFGMTTSSDKKVAIFGNSGNVQLSDSGNNNSLELSYTNGITFNNGGTFVYLKPVVVSTW